MHRKTELEYKIRFRAKSLRDLLYEFIELNNYYHCTVVNFLMHPNPPNKDYDLVYIQFIQKKIEILQEIIRDKQDE